MHEDEKKIRELHERWGTAVRASSIEGYIDCLDEKITMRPPGGPTIDGHENYRKFLGPVFEAATYKGEMHGDYDIEIFGDFAISRNRQTVYVTFKDGATNIASEGALQNTVNTSDYMDILKRQDNGEWKCLVHTWQAVTDT